MFVLLAFSPTAFVTLIQDVVSTLNTTGPSFVMAVTNTITSSSAYSNLVVATFLPWRELSSARDTKYEK